MHVKMNVKLLHKLKKGFQAKLKTLNAVKQREITGRFCIEQQSKMRSSRESICQAWSEKRLRVKRHQETFETEEKLQFLSLTDIKQVMRLAVKE